MRAALQAASASWARPGDIVRIVDDDKQDGKLALDTFSSVEQKVSSASLPSCLSSSTMRTISPGLAQEAEAACSAARICAARSEERRAGKEGRSRSCPDR